MADLRRSCPCAQPVGRVETFTTNGDQPRRVDRAIDTEDAAGLLVRFEGGARGVARSRRSAPGARTTCTGKSTARRRAAAWRAEARRSCGSATATARTSLLRDPAASALAPSPPARGTPRASPRPSASSTARSTPRSQRRPARAAGLPDLRRGPRAGADRRRDRPLARRGPGVGVEPLTSASSSTATARSSTPSRWPGEAWRRVAASPTATR